MSIYLQGTSLSKLDSHDVAYNYRLHDPEWLLSGGWVSSDQDSATAQDVFRMHVRKSFGQMCFLYGLNPRRVANVFRLGDRPSHRRAIRLDKFTYFDKYRNNGFYLIFEMIFGIGQTQSALYPRIRLGFLYGKSRYTQLLLD